MNKTMRTIGLALMLTVTVQAQQPASVATAGREQAVHILKDTGVTGGLIAHLGCGDGKLTAASWTGEWFVVQGSDADVTDMESL